MEEELSAEPQVSTNDEKQLWNGVWSMRVPPKVKTLLWRACREAMPTKSALFRRTILTDSLCVRCQAHSEDSMHALWSYPELDSMWSDIELFAITAWTIWNQWNLVRLNQPADSLHQIPYISKFWLAEYYARQLPIATPVQQTRSTRIHWKPPP